MVQIRSTKSAVENKLPKVAVYGQSGVGKTSLAKTLPHGEVLIIDAEGGLMSVADADIDSTPIGKFQDILDLYKWLTESKEAKKYKHLIFDSLSDVAEVCLDYEKTQVNDKRQAYGNTNDKMMYIMRQFRDLPFSVAYLCKLEKNKDEVTGAMLYSPLMPGQQLPKQLPYLMDAVLALRMTAPDKDGNCERYLQTQPDFQWEAKCRNAPGRELDAREPANLGWIYDKLQGYHPYQLWYYHAESDSYVLMTGREAEQANNTDPGGVTKIGSDESKEKHMAWIAKKAAEQAKAEEESGE
ncbi:putative P-loop containing nucleoside triphosphatehydrolase [Salmonella phage S144]|uniref:Putative P-loop containing nucleoside triphosphatehydrolase n=1 Tax=Salmonella phage S144 TaxID=2759179 RepID=A0A7G5CF44_9CAUD|nr:putative P-loop containing nucleoside triphosphatehydrolase [Salmonella phage S144]